MKTLKIIIQVLSPIIIANGICYYINNRLLNPLTTMALLFVTAQILIKLYQHYEK